MFDSIIWISCLVNCPQPIKEVRLVPQITKAFDSA